MILYHSVPEHDHRVYIYIISTRFLYPIVYCVQKVVITKWRLYPNGYCTQTVLYPNGYCTQTLTTVYPNGYDIRTGIIYPNGYCTQTVFISEWLLYPNGRYCISKRLRYPNGFYIQTDNKSKPLLYPNGYSIQTVLVLQDIVVIVYSGSVWRAPVRVRSGCQAGVGAGTANVCRQTCPAIRYRVSSSPTDGCGRLTC